MMSSPRTLSTTQSARDDESSSGSRSSSHRRDSFSSVASSNLANGTTPPDEEPDGRGQPNGHHANGVSANGHHQQNILSEKPPTQVEIFLRELAVLVKTLPTKIDVKNPDTSEQAEINLQKYFLELKQFSMPEKTDTVTMCNDRKQLSYVKVDSISQLLQELAGVKRLHKVKKIKLTDEQLYALDQCELRLMRIALYQVDKVETKSKPPGAKAKYLLTRIGVFASMVLGVIYCGAESFTGASDLFGGLLSIVEPITFGISVGFAVLSIMLFFGLEAKGFMVEAGISSPFSITRTVKLAAQKLEVANAFSHALRNPKQNYRIVNNLNLYRANHKLLKVFQKEVATKLDNLKNPDGFIRTRVYPVLKSIFSISGAALFACGGVIIGKDLVANIAALSFGVALANPIAFAVIVTLAVAGFSLFYALQHRGALDLFDGITGRPRELLEAQKDFIEDSINANQNVLTHIQNIGAKKERASRMEIYQAGQSDNQWMNVMMPAECQSQTLRERPPTPVLPDAVTPDAATATETSGAGQKPTSFFSIAERLGNMIWAPIVPVVCPQPAELPPVEPIYKRTRSISI